MAKILLIVAIVISAATAVLGFMNQSTLKQTKDDLAQTTTSLNSTKSTLASTQKKLTDTEQTLETTTADKEKLSGDLSNAQQAQQTAESALEEANTKIADQTTQIDDLNSQLQQIRDSMGGDNNGGEQIDVAALKAQIEESNAMVSKLEEENRNSKQELSTLQEKEKSRAAGLMKPGLEGQILAVNPAWNFVVLSMGDKQGVVNNAELLIKRGGQYLGKVRVTSVEPSTSIADIVANSLPAGVSVQPGDSVIYQGSGE